MPPAGRIVPGDSTATMCGRWDTNVKLQVMNAEVNDELGRRRRKWDIPEQISGLVKERREIGVDESQLLEAVTTIRLPSTENV